jgi:hypothetical protein
MIHALTSILYALLLFVGVVQVDQHIIIKRIEPDTLSYGRTERLWTSKQ